MPSRAGAMPMCAPICSSPVSMQLYCNYMDEGVKTDRRRLRRAETERRLVESASALFVERGYAATTLADVAEHADVAPRTLYLHFSTKAELLLRCIGIA